MRPQLGRQGNRGVFGVGMEEAINGSLMLKASTMANDVFHELSIARVLRGDVFGDHARLCHLTRIRSATTTGSERQSEWKCFYHGKSDRAAGSRSLHR